MIEYLAAGAASAFFLGIAYQYQAANRDKSKFPPRGEFIELGDRKIHVVNSHSFEGGPTVILEAGNGLTSSSWMLVQSEVAKFANCLSYDRAGFGWSKRRKPGSNFLEDDVKDLSNLLAKMNAPKPYILVGHSYGGMICRVFSERYPSDVGRLIFVDAYHENQLKIIPLPSDTLLRMFHFLVFTGVFRVFIQKLFPLPPDLPTEMRSRIHAEIAAYDWIKTTRDFFSNAKESLKVLENIPIFNQPLAVISAAVRNGPELKFKPQIDALQKSLTTLSRQGMQIIADKSGHNIPFTDPKIIIDTIRGMVKQTENNTK